MMKKRLSRILTTALILGLMAAMPASTQTLSGSGIDGTTGSNLPLIISINRLALTEDQMVSLHNILAELLASKSERDSMVAQFENAMLGFNGTSEELDALLVAFREDQAAHAEAMRESIATSLDQVRDLLSINQGRVLREALPQLLGMDRTQSMLQGQIQGSMMRQGGQMQQGTLMGSGTDSCLDPSQRGGQTSYWRVVPSESVQRGQGLDSRSMMQQSMRGQQSMLGGRIELSLGSTDDMATIRQQIGERLDALGERMPEELRASLEERLQGGIAAFGERMEAGVGRMTLQSQNGRGQMGVSSLMGTGQAMNRPQGQGGNDLLAFLEQVVEILELKLEALE
ncbi:hypothetical protein IH601_01910 [Candidatus Bipolaricaulota bacterium]|nr:hypothetical protein [Candidatus Bipolaricaulota bacterium]